MAFCAKDEEKEKEKGKDKDKDKDKDGPARLQRRGRKVICRKRKKSRCSVIRSLPYPVARP